jgi:hypothetical protein
MTTAVFRFSLLKACSLNSDMFPFEVKRRSKIDRMHTELHLTLLSPMKDNFFVLQEVKIWVVTNC